mgnify:CR=1 FL=1
MAEKKKKGKEVVKTVKFQAPAGAANPSPPIGPILGQAGVNIMEFCNQFNDKTKDFERNAPIPVTLYVYSDRSFDFTLKSPPASYMILKALKIKKGSGTPSNEVIARISQKQLTEVAEAKMNDLNANDIEAAKKIIAGSARSMGIEVVEG